MSLFFFACLNVPQGQPLSPTAGTAPVRTGGRSQEVLLGFVDGTWSMSVMGSRGCQPECICGKHVGGEGSF